MEVIVVTTRRVRHGIVLALAGLLAGLGIVAALFWDGGLIRLRQSATEEAAPAAGSRSALAELPPAAPQAPARDTASPAPATQDRAEAPPPATADATAPKRADEGGPRFDIVRVEPNGDAVIAGRGKPNSVVEMLVDGQPVARALTDPSGQFAIVPPPLPRGASEIVLRSKSADGQETRSAQSIAVSIAPNGDSQPLVALTSPDAPTVVLSQPGAASASAASPRPGDGGGNTRMAAGSGGPGAADAPDTGHAAKVARDPGAGDMAKAGDGARPGEVARAGRDARAGDATGTAGSPAAPLRIVSVDGEGSGRLFISGVGRPGTEVRLYLNDTLIAPTKVGPDGHLAFTIGRGISAGRYKIRVEEVDPRTGKVAHRSEVAFVMPEASQAETRQAQAQAPAGAGAGAGANPAPAPGANPAVPPAGARSTQAQTPAGARSAQAQTPAGVKSAQTPAGVKSAQTPAGVKSMQAPAGDDPAQAPAGSGRAQAQATPKAVGEAAARPDGRPLGGNMAALDAPARPRPGEVPGTTRTGTVFVPEITTARITRGDNLWQISKRTYGHGRRYTVIFDANQDQIRDPDLIYPGQTFVLPVEQRG